MKPDPRLTAMDGHLCAAIRSISDLARMLDAVRYTAGLSKGQAERIKRAREIAAEAESFLSSVSEGKKA